MFKLIRLLAGIGLAAAILVGSNLLAKTGEGDVLGAWVTQKGESKITIYKCGKNSKFYCGKITWLKEPLYPAADAEAGKPKRDRENPDPAQQNRRIMGLNLVWGFNWDGEKWSDGKIYNPENGKTYSCFMELVAPNKLKVKGYIGFSLFGEERYWTR